MLNQIMNWVEINSARKPVESMAINQSLVEDDNRCVSVQVMKLNKLR